MCIYECICELLCAPLYDCTHEHPSLEAVGVSAQSEPSTGRHPEALRNCGTHLSCLGSVLVEDGGKEGPGFWLIDVEKVGDGCRAMGDPEGLGSGD